MNRAVAGEGTLRLRRELAAGLGVYVVWQYLVWLTGRQPAGPALAHGLQLWRLEGVLHLRWEHGLQLAAGQLGVVQSANVYYATAHVAGAAVLLVACWRRGGHVYRPVRNVLLVVTLASFVLQLWQAAPLRLLGVGVADTAQAGHLSVYAAARGHVDVFSAFPSLHVGWALVVAWAALRFGSSWWRVAGVAHGALTVLVVMVTGNHSVLDCAAAAVVVAGSVGVVAYAGRRALHRVGGVHRLGDLSGVAREAA